MLPGGRPTDSASACDVGGLPYVLPEFPGVPVYASTLARGLLGNKIKEHKLHNNPILALEPGDEVQIGPFGVVAFRQAS